MWDRKYFVLEMPDGSIALGNFPPTPPGVSEEEWIEKKLRQTKNASPQYAAAKRLPDRLPEELPSHRFFDSWRNDGTGKIHVDMPLARAQCMAKIRRDRDARFTPLDNEWMKATGQGDAAQAAQIEAVRQALREIPQKIDLGSIDTAEALEAFEPDWPSV